MTDARHDRTHEVPAGSNADDPTADRLAAYPEAGELDSPQGAVDRSADGPLPPQPAGTDSTVIFTGASGGAIGGPAATDAPGAGAGRPAADGAADGDPEATADRLRPDSGSARDDDSFVDRLEG